MEKIFSIFFSICLATTAFGQIEYLASGPQVSVKGRVLNLTVANDGRSFSFQDFNENIAQGAMLSYGVDKSGVVREMPAQYPSAEYNKAISLPGKMQDHQVLAVTANGQLLSSRMVKTPTAKTTGRIEYVSLQNVYLNDTSAKTQKLVWQGKLCDEVDGFHFFLTPDNSHAVVIDDESGFYLNLIDGSRSSLDRSLTAFPDMHLNATLRMLGNKYFVLGTYDDNSTTIWLYGLPSGKLLDKKLLPGFQIGQMYKDSVLYVINEFKGSITGIDLNDPKLTETKWMLPTTALPLATGGQYYYRILDGGMLLILPKQPLSQYNTSVYSPSMLIYNLALDRVDQLWPSFMQGAPVNKTSYSSFFKKITTNSE